MQDPHGEESPETAVEPTPNRRERRARATQEKKRSRKVKKAFERRAAKRFQAVQKMLGVAAGDANEYKLR